MRLYTIFVRHGDGALRPVADMTANLAGSALRDYRALHPDERGPFVVLPSLTSAPFCVD